MGKQFKDRRVVKTIVKQEEAEIKQEQLPQREAGQSKTKEKIERTQPIKKQRKEKKGKQADQQANIVVAEEGTTKKEKKDKKEKKEIKGKKNRLIIRNLVFDVSDKHLRKLLEPFGKIAEVQIPKNPNNEKLNKGFAFVEFANYRSCEKAIKELNQSKFKGRNIVLDFSLSKQKFMTKKMEDGENTEKQPKTEENAMKQEAEEEAEIQAEQVPEKIEEEKPAVEKPAEDLSSTIFIRNMPTNIDEQQLKDFFARYGKVKWARIVIDKETKQPKGTAFVKYADPEHAHAIIEYSRSYQMFLLGKLPRFRKDPRYSLEMEGTIVKIFPVLERATIAEKLKDRAEEANPKVVKKLKPLKKMKKLDDLIAFDKDGKRRVDLAAFGFWQPTEDMNEEDEQRFKAHSREKIQKLKNPNIAVSDKRVILKYLDKSITEEQIKDLTYQFLRNTNIPTRQLTFCKLMLDADRKKSAGYAFLEFSHHSTSRNFIDALSQNQQMLMERPFVVQFALQDSRKLQKLKNRQK